MPSTDLTVPLHLSNCAIDDSCACDGFGPKRDGHTNCDEDCRNTASCGCDTACSSAACDSGAGVYTFWRVWLSLTVQSIQGSSHPSSNPLGSYCNRAMMPDLGCSPVYDEGQRLHTSYAPQRTSVCHHSSDYHRDVCMQLQTNRLLRRSQFIFGVYCMRVRFAGACGCCKTRVLQGVIMGRGATTPAAATATAAATASIFSAVSTVGVTASAGVTKVVAQIQAVRMTR